MSMMDQEAPISNTKSDRLAEITREQYDDYKTRFRPVEDKLIDSVGNPELMQDGLNRVSQSTTTAGRVMSESAEMRAGRTGGMSAEQRTALNKKMDLGLSATEVSGKNKVRDYIYDRDTQNLSSLVDNGTGVRGLANASFSSAASLEASRNAANQGIAVGNTAGRWAAAPHQLAVGAASI